MTIDAQIAALTEAMEYKSPFLHWDLNELADARNKLITSVDLRVKWINNLRSVVARKCPKNKMNVPIVSDVDLLFAEASELLEALVKTIGKWEK